MFRGILTCLGCRFANKISGMYAWGASNVMKGGIAGNKSVGCTSIVCSAKKFPNVLDYNKSGKQCGPFLSNQSGWWIDYYVPLQHKGNACLLTSAAKHNPIGIFIGPQSDKTSSWFLANPDNATTLYWADGCVVSCREETRMAETFYVYRLVSSERGPWNTLTKSIVQENCKFKIFVS